MSDKPIMFRPDMVRAIIEGRKRQTRRPLKPQPPMVEDVIKLSGIDFGIFKPTSLDEWCVSGPVWAVRELMDTGDMTPSWTPRYPVGTRLWVKEAHWIVEREGRGVWKSFLLFDDEIDRECGLPVETAPLRPVNCPKRWGRRSPLFLPRRYARLWLRVTNVRVERVQDISEEDATGEGVEATPVATPREVFVDLWDEIYAKKPGLRWDDNPWVWVYEFEVVSCSTASTLSW